MSLVCNDPCGDVWQNFEAEDHDDWEWYRIDSGMVRLSEDIEIQIKKENPVHREKAFLHISLIHHTKYWGIRQKAVWFWVFILIRNIKSKVYC